MKRTLSNLATLSTIASDVTPFSAHLCDSGYGEKPVLPALSLVIGICSQGDRELAFVVVDSPRIMYALQHSMSVEEARGTAAALIATADKLEANAAAQAGAALAKAAGK